MNIDFDINEVTSDILGMIWEKLVELDGETGPISGVTTLFLRSFHDVICKAPYPGILLCKISRQYLLAFLRYAIIKIDKIKFHKT